MHSYDEKQFLQSVQSAVDHISKLIDTETHPVRLLTSEETEHSYNDKFTVAEQLSTTVQQAVRTVLDEALGLSPEHQAVLDQWVTNKDAITLRFFATHSCTFLEEKQVQVRFEPVQTQQVKTSGGLLCGSTRVPCKTTVFRTVKEFRWKVRLEYKLSLYAGNDEDGGIVLQERTCDSTMASQAKGTPLQLPVKSVVEAPITWFCSNKAFAIDRNTDQPITPRRNREVQAAFEAVSQLSTFARKFCEFFQTHLQKRIVDEDKPVIPRSTLGYGGLSVGAIATLRGFMKESPFNGQKVRIVKCLSYCYDLEPLDPKGGLPHAMRLSAVNLLPDQSPTSGPSLCEIDGSTVIVPLLPLLEDDATTTVAAALSEHVRTLRSAVCDVEKSYSTSRLAEMITSQDAVIVLCMSHLETLLQRYKESINFIEETLRQQLVVAIGEAVDSNDFRAYMQYHFSRRLFARNYRPTPFCRAVRRPGCFPDGTIALEQVVPQSSNITVSTWARETPAGAPFYVPIHAAASVELTGPQYLHGWMQHRFRGDDAPPSFQLACRARQFSSFLIILGTLSGPDTLDPQHAVIVQNKDELLIPLITDPLPSATEFKDAIQSLSPEQQAFAKEFRSMQLSTSVFGVCVIQLKPQLETLLQLPDKALTKELQLTQDLMTLFVDHQIPSDMLTYDGPSETTSADKRSTVKEHTQSVLDVIEDSKKKQLKDEEMKAEMRFEKGSFATEQTTSCEDLAAPLAYPPPPGGVISHPAKMQNLHRLAGCMTPQMAGFGGGFVAASAMVGFGGGGDGGLLECRSEPDFILMRSSRAFASEIPDKSGRVQKQPPMPQDATTNLSRPLEGFEGFSPTEYVSPGEGCGLEDFTTIPKILDGKLERLDQGGSLRSTTVKAATRWTRTRQENLLAESQSSSLSKNDVEKEKQKAFDLLDSISRSGSLSIASSELHVFVAVSHCFENDVMDTVIKDNENPIAKVERSALLLASTTLGVATHELVANDRDLQRLSSAFPQLFVANAQDY